MKLTATLLVIATLVMSCSSPESVTTTTIEATTQRDLLIDARQDLPNASNELEIGQLYRFSFYIHCGMRYLRPTVDSRNWETVSPPFDAGRYPDSWREAFSNPLESISPELLGTLELIDENTLEFRVPGFGIEAVYSPTTAELPGCA